MNYYKSLNIHMRIEFKELFMNMEPFNALFVVCSFREVFELIVQKLIMEGFEINN